jgi:hypothetical protein
VIRNQDSPLRAGCHTGIDRIGTGIDRIGKGKTITRSKKVESEKLEGSL